MSKRFRESKKALSTVLAAVVLVALAWLKAPGEAYLAVAAVWGAHQLAQGGQDAMAAYRGKGERQEPA